MLQEGNKAGLEILNWLTQYKAVELWAYIFADLPIFFIPIFLVSLRLYANIKEKYNIKPKLMFIFYGCVIAIIISLCIQQFIVFDRPELHIVNSGKLLLKHIPDASFPSDHASVSFAFVTGLYIFGFRKTFYWYFPFVLLMNTSRIIAGVHWPFDVFVWAFVWFFSAIWTKKWLTENKFVKKCNTLIIQALRFIKL